jgi:hypothetical protein
MEKAVQLTNHRFTVVLGQSIQGYIEIGRNQMSAPTYCHDIGSTVGHNHTQRLTEGFYTAKDIHDVHRVVTRG